MSRLTLRLPQTLHTELTDLAESEGVSLNQYIVYALSRQATLAYTIQPVSEQAVREQRASYTALLNSLGTASFEEIEETLAEREVAEPEPGLTPDVVARLQQRIAAKKQAMRAGVN
ncbi:MAG: toxin-antitoxin system HicB family antitoxin [Chloroflexi bacterium]|nr:MAG: toxin-antitoxin system HicB family antitoxin [Chloroflexota bacterium]